MKRVVLSENKLDDDMTAILSTCLHNIEELYVRDCLLTARGIENISDAMRKIALPVNLSNLL